MMEKDQIVVVGGYGSVGKKICQRLSEMFPYQVYAAGRSLSQAEKFSREMEGKVKPLQWDIQQHPASYVEEQATITTAIEGETCSEVRSVDDSMMQKRFEQVYQWSRVKLVIMCLDQKDTTWVKYCLQAGIYYIDISAQDSFLYQIEQLDSSLWQATALLSVGLAPGLTNLLAQQVHQQLDHTDRLELSIVLGLGEHHGQAAIAWTVDQLNTLFSVKEKGEWQKVQSFTDKKVVNFGAKLPVQPVYRFPFSDQQSLARTTDIASISTRLGFDSIGTTRLLAGLQHLGVFRMLSISWVRQIILYVFNNLHLGSEQYGIRAEATGIYQGKSVNVCGWLTGYNQSTVTAEVAAIVATFLYTTQMPYGTYHLEQVIDWQHIVEQLEHRVEIQWDIDQL
jgi:saccharopine dehydrogenase (NAD+, L-lysine-forming)